MRGSSWKWLLAAAGLLALYFGSIWFIDAGFGGTDAVVEQVAARYGAEASDPLINTDRGILLPLLFGLAGFVCGFYIVRTWQTVAQTDEQTDHKTDERKDETDGASFPR